jgi:hypothetical protein
MVTYTEIAILRTRWTAEKALNHPALTWVDGVAYHNGKRLILQGEDKAALIEPVYHQCDPRLSVEGLYDEVNRLREYHQARCQVLPLYDAPGEQKSTVCAGQAASV